MANLSVRLIIKGHVQGVWFRDWTVKTARQLGLFGWVRNRMEGCVEAVFCGDKASIEIMIESCYKGPDGASVTDIKVLYENINVKSDFKKISTL